MSHQNQPFGKGYAVDTRRSLAPYPKQHIIRETRKEIYRQKSKPKAKKPKKQCSPAKLDNDPKVKKKNHRNHEHKIRKEFERPGTSAGSREVKTALGA